MILDHWEMCAVRNRAAASSSRQTILDHWEMCAVRNRLFSASATCSDSRSLGDVRCPELASHA